MLGSQRSEPANGAYTCDEVGQPMSALKLRAEMGHGSMKMLEERYFKATRFRCPRPHLEYRWSDWAGTYRDRLAERPMASKEWAVQVGMPAGTFYPTRARLVQMELVVREGEGRGARWALNEDGWATVRALGFPAQRRLAA